MGLPTPHLIVSIILFIIINTSSCQNHCLIPRSKPIRKILVRLQKEIEYCRKNVRKLQVLEQNTSKVSSLDISEVYKKIGGLLLKVQITQT